MKRLLSLGAVSLAAVALAGCGVLEPDSVDSADSVDSTDSVESNTDVSSEQVDAVADAEPGDCLPQEVVSSDPEVFEVDCSSPEAYWTITAIDGDTDATAALGDLTDHQHAFDLCGDEVGALLPGKPLTDWNMIYDQISGEVDYLFCIEALTEPDDEGRVAVVPAAGDCFASSDAEWSTLPCDSALADYSVVDVVELELAEHDQADLDAAAVGCGDSAYYELTDLFGRTSALLCIE